MVSLVVILPIEILLWFSLFLTGIQVKLCWVTSEQGKGMWKLVYIIHKVNTQCSVLGEDILIWSFFSNKMFSLYCSVPQALRKMLGISTKVKTLSDLYEWGVLSRPMNNYLSLEGFGQQHYQRWSFQSSKTLYWNLPLDIY